MDGWGCSGRKRGQSHLCAASVGQQGVANGGLSSVAHLGVWCELYCAKNGVGSQHAGQHGRVGVSERVVLRGETRDAVRCGEMRRGCGEAECVMRRQQIRPSRPTTTKMVPCITHQPAPLIISRPQLTWASYSVFHSSVDVSSRKEKASHSRNDSLPKLGRSGRHSNGSRAPRNQMGGRGVPTPGRGAYIRNARSERGTHIRKASSEL